MLAPQCVMDAGRKVGKHVAEYCSSTTMLFLEAWRGSPSMSKKFEKRGDEPGVQLRHVELGRAVQAIRNFEA